MELVVTDGGKGLINAMQTVLPGIPMQRCWANKTRNITDRVKRADRDSVKRDIRRIYDGRHTEGSTQCRSSLCRPLAGPLSEGRSLPAIRSG